MTEVLLHHHIQGLTDGVLAFADDVRRAGHTVHTPDLFDGRTFDTLEEGFGFARDAGFDQIRERGTAAADALGEGLGEGIVHAGISFGVTIAQRLAQTLPGARGALLLCSCLPVTELAAGWPAAVPVQVHGKEGDEFFAEDLPAARELVESAALAELFVYPGDQHLFVDSSLDDHDPDAAALLSDRVLSFLASV